MTYVIAEPCIGTKDTACVEVCPVDCIHPKKDSAEYAASSTRRGSKFPATQASYARGRNDGGFRVYLGEMTSVPVVDHRARVSGPFDAAHGCTGTCPSPVQAEVRTTTPTADSR